MEFKLVDATDKILSEVASEVTFPLSMRDYELIDCLWDVLREHAGYGVAAPQCGHSKRIFVYRTLTSKRYTIINPVILNSSKRTTTREEGCLSLPGVRVNVTRPKTIKVEWFDQNGDKHIQTLDGTASRVFQHELDHLNGITILTINKPKATDDL